MEAIIAGIKSGGKKEKSMHILNQTGDGSMVGT
jgi:hypothetical protein